MVDSFAPSSWIMVARLCARFSWLIMTPLGSLVLPLVNCKNATSSRDTFCASAGSGGADFLGSLSTMIQSSLGQAASFANYSSRTTISTMNGQNMATAASSRKAGTIFFRSATLL